MGRKGPFLLRVVAVLDMLGRAYEELPHRVAEGLGSGIEIAADDRSIPVLRRGEPFDAFQNGLDLSDAGASRAKVQVQVNDIDGAIPDLHARFHEPFFADRLFSEWIDIAMENRVFGKKSVTVAQGFSSEAGIVDAVFGVGVLGLVLDVLKQIDVPVPMRGLIDFLERDDIRRVSLHQASYLLEILSNAIRTMEPLVER